MLNLFQSRFYAVAAKTAVKSTTNVNSANIPALPFFTPSPPTGPPIDHSLTHPNDLSLQWHPNWKSPLHSQLRTIDFDHRVRYDSDGRSALFASMHLGSAVVVEQVSSRTQPRKQLFSGLVVSKRERGIRSSFTVRGFILKTGIEIMFPLYSPMVVKIHVLKDVESGATYGDSKTLRFRGEPRVVDLPVEVDADTLVLGIDEMTTQYIEKEKRKNLTLKK